MRQKISVFEIGFGIIIALFFSAVGFFIGVYDEQKRNTGFSVVENHENTCNVPTINIHKIENGILPITTIESIFPSEIRIIIDGKKDSLFILDKKSNSIKIDVTSILPKIETIPAPAWAKFVGSKRGSTFWPLDHPRAFILAPKNRVFFKSKEDAFLHHYKYDPQ